MMFDMKMKIPKYVWYIWAALIPIGLITVVLVTQILNNAPELKMALTAAQTNPSVLAIFGDDSEVSYHSDYPSSLSFGTDGRHGKYCFRVAGSKGSGKIVVYWVSESKGKHFRVSVIERYYTNGKKSEILWNPP